MHATLNNTALIDGDWLCYAVCTSPNILTEQYYEEDDEVSYSLNISEACTEVLERAEQYLEATQCSSFVLCFGGRRNFRKELCSSYKAGRKSSPKPLGYRAVIERLATLCCCAWCDGYEGDDVMAMLSKRGEGNVIVSVDKDMLTVPGLVYNPMHHERGVVLVSANEAKRNVAMQTLHGDSTDGYTGIPGIGPKKAEALLRGIKTDALWKTVLHAYEAAGLSEADARLTAKLAQIVYDADEDIQFSEPPRISGSPRVEANDAGSAALDALLGLDNKANVENKE